MARRADSSPPSSSPQRPTTRARTVAFENAKLPRTRSRTTDTVPQQRPLVKEKSPAKKKTASISYDTITRVGPPRGHKKNHTSAPPRTTDEATISTNRQHTGGSVSDAVGYVLFFFHYRFNLLGTRLRVVSWPFYLDFASVAWHFRMLDFASHCLFSFSARTITNNNCFADLMSDLLWTLVILHLSQRYPKSFKRPCPQKRCETLFYSYLCIC
jgi:hypothetical protein